MYFLSTTIFIAISYRVYFECHGRMLTGARPTKLQTIRCGLVKRALSAVTLVFNTEISEICLQMGNAL